jgi:hypothetical protein
MVLATAALAGSLVATDAQARGPGGGGRIGGFAKAHIGGFAGGQIAGYGGGRIRGFAGGHLGAVAAGQIAGYGGGRIRGFAEGHLGAVAGGRIGGYGGVRVAGIHPGIHQVYLGYGRSDTHHDEEPVVRSSAYFYKYARRDLASGVLSNDSVGCPYYSSYSSPYNCIYSGQTNTSATQSLP